MNQYLVRCQVTIGPRDLLPCRIRRLNAAFLQMKPKKPRPCVSTGVAR